MDKTSEELLLEELAQRSNQQAFKPIIFDKQQAVIDDPSKFKALLTSRRGGKTTVAANYLYQEAAKEPDRETHYIGLTRKACKRIMWKELKLLNKQHNLGMQFNSTDLIATLNQGSTIYLIGGNDEDAIETLRGEKSKLVTIDEAGSYRGHLQYMLDDVITPLLIDWDGTLCMMGTPTAACSGPFYDATMGVDPSYSVHKWTILDNPYIPHAKRWLEAYRAKKQWQDDNPIYLREWCGRWVKSADSLVYKYLSQNNDLKELPNGKYRYIIGVDIGYNDATAFTIGAVRDHDPTFYIVATYKKTNMIVDQIMSKLADLIKQYNPDRIVMDSGGGGKLVAQSFSQRYSIPVSPAQKTDKRDFIEQMNSDFISGRIKVLPGNKQLIDEWEIVQWDEDHKREDERFICDLCFTPGNGVMTTEGVKNIEDIVIGDLVLTHAGAFKAVTNTMSREYSGKILSIDVKGRPGTISCTPNHPFLAALTARSGKVINGRKLTGQRISGPLSWVTAENLISRKSYQKSHELFAPVLPAKDKTVHISDEMCFLYGYYVAEGSLSSHKTQISFAGHRKEANVVSLLQKAVSLDYSDYKIGNRKPKTPKITVSFSKLNKGRVLHLRIRPLCIELSKLGTFKDKHFPLWIKDLTEEQAIWMLLGYFFGDGHFNKDGRVQSSSISRDITYGLELLCLISGMSGSIGFLRRKDRYKGLGISGLTKNDMWTFSLNRKNTRKLLDFISRNSLLKHTFEDKLVHPFEDTYKDSSVDSNLKPINAIKSNVYVGKVYNLEVEDDHSYTVNGVAVHNCDSTLYTWRESTHFTESPKEVLPEPNSDAWHRRMEEEMERRSEEDYHKAQSLEDPNGEPGDFGTTGW